MTDVKTKVCIHCNEEKPVEDFNFKNREKGWYMSYCKPCQKVYNRKHYEKNRDLYLARSHEQKKGLRPHQIWEQRSRPYGRISLANEDETNE